MSAVTRDSFSRWIRIPIRGNDVDARGHVNNAVIITYFEGARRDFFHAHPLFAEYEERGQIVVLVTQTCTYRRQLRYPGAVEVGLGLREIRTRSFTFECGVFLADEPTLVAEGHTTHAWVDESSEKAIALPGDIKDTLESLR